MQKHFKLGRPSHATVVAYVALFVALGGSAFAATQLAKNSVGAKQLKKNAVTTAKIKKEAVTAAKVKKGTLTGAQINASTLGTVPVADSAKSAIVANSLPPAESWHEVGAPGEPVFQNGWEDVGPGNIPAGFYKDQLGIVHLRGAVKAPSSSEQSIFKLPPGFRPTPKKDSIFTGYCVVGAFCGTWFEERIDVAGGDYEPPELSGTVLASPANFLSLDGITFRAES
jgi:hypothetical protein